MAVMRSTRAAKVPPWKVVEKRSFYNIPLACCGEYELGSYYQLGQMSQGAQAGVSVAAAAATFVPVVGPVLGPIISVFGKIFGGGKSKKQAKAESMQRRAARAAGPLQAVANVLTNFPNAVENRIMNGLQKVWSVGGQENLETLKYGAPCEAQDAMISIDANVFGKKAAIRGMQSQQAQVREWRASNPLCGQAWWDAYLSGKLQDIFGPIDPGYARLMAGAYSGPVTNISGRWTTDGQKITVSQSGTNLTMTVDGGGSVTGKFTGQSRICVEDQQNEYCANVTGTSITWDAGPSWKREVVAVAAPVAIATPIAQAGPVTQPVAQVPSVAAPVPSGQTTILTGGPAVMPSWMTPTSDGQAVAPIQAGAMSGSAMGWVALGGLFLLPFLFGGKTQRRSKRRYPRGTTVTRRY